MYNSAEKSSDEFDAAADYTFQRILQSLAKLER
jgi:hypothetical protein